MPRATPYLHATQPTGGSAPYPLSFLKRSSLLIRRFKAQSLQTPHLHGVETWDSFPSLHILQGRRETLGSSSSCVCVCWCACSCVHTSVQVHACVWAHVHTHMCLKSKAGIVHLSQLFLCLTFFLLMEIESLTEPGVYQLGHTNWPASLWEGLVSTSSALELQACATYSAFSMDVGNPT